MLLFDQTYLTSIRDALREAERVDVAVAFWGTGSEHILDELNAKARLICNLLSGGTNPAPIAILRGRNNIEVRHFAELHAKVLLTNSVAIVGSANFSTNGLHYEADEIRGWREAGLLSQDSSVLHSAQQWFDQLWSESRAITDADMNQAALAWEKARRYRTIAKTGNPDQLPTRAEMIDRTIYVVIWGEEASKEAEGQIGQVRRAQKGRREDAEELDYYEDWKALPKNSSLIDVHIGSRRGISIGYIYRRVPSLDRVFQRKDGTSGSIQVVAPEETRRELPFNWNTSIRTALKKRLVNQLNLRPLPVIGSVFPLFEVLE